jgi:hypothetical protein
MKISFNEMDNIVRTLPIGYYAKKRIPTKLDHCETSYFDLVSKTITVSFEGVNIALEKVPEQYQETAVRSSLYHEVSHAILSSTKIFTDFDKVSWYGNCKMTPEFNVFEDERIETIMKDEFLNVDFESNRHWINGRVPTDPIEAPKDCFGAFYNLVRFHYGTQNWLDEVNALLDEYSYLSVANENDSIWDWYRYYEKVEDLYKRFCNEYGADPEEYANNSGFGGFVVDIQGEVGESAEGEGANATENAEGEGEEKDGEQNGKGNPSKSNSTSMKNGGRMGGAGELLSNLYGKIAEKYTLDAKTYGQLEGILANFNKKNGGGSAIYSYSGRLNPKQMIRDEYKIFERKSSVRGSNTYGSLHLNLFIDVSGSFWHNEEPVNKLLACLQELERKYPYFSFDLVKCGNGQTLAEKNARFIKTGGGNWLTEEVISLFRKLQKPQTQNCNIMLFDGDCCPDNNVFERLDNSNLTIIAESDNARYLRKTEKAKVIMQNNDYANVLTDNVVKTIARAFK